MRLSRALDVAAAQSDSDAALSGTEPVLIERIDAEYGRYFTPTGRPTGEWAAAISRLADAEAAVTECAAAVAEVDDRVRRHAVLTEQVAELSQLRLAAGPRLAVAQAAADKIAALTRQAREAKLVADAAAATNAASAAAHSGRLRLAAEIETRATTIAAAETEAQEAVDAQSAARADAEAAGAAVEEAAEVLAAAQRRVELTRLTARLAKIDAIQRDRDRVCAELSTVTLTEELLQRIEKAAAAVDRTSDQLALISAAVELTAATDIELAVGDQRVSLPAGQSWSTTVTGATEVEVVGVVTARVTPGTTALDVQAKHVAAQEELATALAAADVADLAAARGVDQRRRELHSSRDQLSATLEGLCGDEQVDELRARLAQLRAVAAPLLDGTEVRAELDAAQTACTAAEAECVTRRQTATAAAAKLTETSTRASVLLNNAATQRVELDRATEQLAQERASVSDADLAAAAEAALKRRANRPAAGRRAGRRVGRRGAGRGERRIGRCRQGGRVTTRALRRRLPGATRNQHRTFGLRQRGSPRQARCRGDRA